MSEIQFYPDKSAGGITGWHWISTDSGAWDGPKKDWEKSHVHMINTHVKQFRTVVQAGGNLGMYPRLLSQMFNRVYTFEPDNLNFKTLVLNCDEENIVKFQAAVGATNDVCSVSRPSMNNVGMHHLQFNKDKSKDYIPVITLDSFSLGNVDLIMFDLEGHEFAALNGAVHTIRTNKPAVFVERPTIEVYQFFDQIGYKPAGQSVMDMVFVAK